MSAGGHAHSSQRRATHGYGLIVDSKNPIDFLVSTDSVDTAVTHPERSLNSRAIWRIEIFKDDTQSDRGRFPGGGRSNPALGGSRSDHQCSNRDKPFPAHVILL